ncbi:MAG: FAD-binding protein [Syntrophales bacterium]|jgi:electron transfer flavoprotein alpha subunit/transcriptional regulator with XRE-family HTH domain|nr:FAD-binding protein [Syntrophales bacterium]MDY0043086.1 FAD-binding protein [Syntrophales bacterium]
MASQKEIWYFADIRNERHFTSTLKVLMMAQKLCDSASAKTSAVLVGSSHINNSADFKEAEISLQEAEKRLIDCGSDFVYLFEEAREMRTDMIVPILSHLVNVKKPLLFLFPLSDFGRELAARTARLCNAGLIADCMDITFTEGRFTALCPSWGGEMVNSITYAEGFHSTGFATVQTGDREILKSKGTPGITIRLKSAEHVRSDEIRLISRSTETGSQKKLEDAEIVVAGGAGLGTASGFAAVRELAASLGGEVGATRPPVLLHWTDEDRLIGQTGKTVHPRLLISAGTSGAIQYTAGIAESEIIAAINRDPMAPIFQTADIGIVADAAVIMPLIASKVKSAMLRDLTNKLQEREKPLSESFGSKLAKIREAHGFTLESLAQATGQNPETIEQFERDETSPSVAFLLRLSKTLKIDPDTFLASHEKKAIRERRAQQFITRTQNYSYQTLTPDGEQEHLRSFLITIEPRQAHKPVAYKHEGEEFIYVMEGKLELTLGGKPHRLTPHESIRFNSEIPHKLKSISDEPTRCLVVLYTP